VLPACAPKYPACDKDGHCKEGEFCVNHLCQQCRMDADCGDNFACNKGRCEARVAPAQCATDADCPENHECQNGRCVAPPRVASAAPSPCAMQTVYFGFDVSTLTPDATSKLQDTARCLKASGRKHRLEGHCDPRGTVEYNIALGDARARSVKRYLSRLGVDNVRPVSKGELEATGTDEASWAKDRKVVPLAD
jgi:peptidoglycan-associated lipoprotein